MKFLIRCSSQVAPRHRDVDLQIDGVEKQTINMGFWSMPGNTMDDYRELEQEFGAIRKSLHIQIGAFFRSIQQWVQTEAVVSNATGIDIVQVERTFLQVNMLHGRVSAGDGQCTVTCKTTGESRSGRNVCIECPSGIGVIRICC